MEKVTISSPLVSAAGYLGPINSVALLIVLFIWLYIIYKQSQGIVLDIPAENFVFKDFQELNYYYGGTNNKFVRLKATGLTEEVKEEKGVAASLINVTPVDGEMVEIGDEVYLNSGGPLLPPDTLSNDYKACEFGAEETKNQLCAISTQRQKCGLYVERKGKRTTTKYRFCGNSAAQETFRLLPLLSTYEVFSESQLSQRIAQKCIIKKAREFYEDKEYTPPTGVWSAFNSFNPFKGNEVTIDGDVVAFKGFDPTLDC